MMWAPLDYLRVAAHLLYIDVMRLSIRLLAILFHFSRVSIPKSQPVKGDFSLAAIQRLNLTQTCFNGFRSREHADSSRRSIGSASSIFSSRRTACVLALSCMKERNISCFKIRYDMRLQNIVYIPLGCQIAISNDKQICMFTQSDSSPYNQPPRLKYIFQERMLVQHSRQYISNCLVAQ